LRKTDRLIQVEYFATLEDPRIERKKLHALVDLMLSMSAEFIIIGNGFIRNWAICPLMPLNLKMSLSKVSAETG